MKILFKLVEALKMDIKNKRNLNQNKLYVCFYIKNLKIKAIKEKK